MAVDIGGNTSLKWEAGIETDKLKKDGREVERILGRVYTEGIKNGKTFSEQLKEQIRLITKMNSLNGGKPTTVPVSGDVSTSGISAYRQAQLEMQKALQESRLEIQRLKKEQADLNIALSKGRVDAQNYRTESARITAEHKRQADANRQARSAQVAANGSYKEAQNRLRELGNQIKNTEGGFRNMSAAQKARIAEYNQLNGALKNFDTQMGNSQRNVGNYRSALKGIGSTLLGLTAGFVSATAAITAVTASFNQSLKSDAVSTSLEFTFGSVDLADAKLLQLQDRAEKLGINYNALTSSYKSFTGAVIASNFDFQEGERIFNAVAGASSRLKLSADDTEGALRALQQMISKGNVQAEELRGQLGERIPGAFSIAARAMGVTESKLNDMLKAGDVLAADMLPKLARELEKTFNTESEEKVTGLSAAVQRMNNVFSTAVSNSGRLSGFFESVINGVTKVSSSIIRIVNSTSWEEFWARMFVSDDGKTGDAIRNISDAFDKGNKAISKASNFDISKAGVKELTVNYEELSIAYNKANEALKIYKAGVSDGSLTDKGKAQIKDLTQTVDVLYSKMQQAQRLLPKSTEKEVEKEKSKAEIAAENREKRRVESATERARTLSKTLSDIHNQSVRNQKESDNAELDSVKDKYRKMLAEAEAFYNNPKNRGASLNLNGKKLTRSQVTGTIKADEARDSETVLAKQSLERTKIVIDEQKAIFSQFEDYKLEYGQAKAEERFKGEKKEYQTYVDYLKSLQPAESDKSVAANLTRDFLSKELPKAVKEANDKAYDNELKNLKRILEATKTAKNEELRINEQYDKDLATLRKSYAGEDLEEREIALARQRQLELEGVKRLAFESSEIGKALATDLFYKTRKELKAQLDKLKELLKDEGLTPEQKKALESSAGNVEELIESSNDFARIANIIANKANEIASALTGLGDAIGGSLGYTISQIGELAGIAGDAAGAAASFASGDIIGGITKGIKAVTGLISMGKKVKEMNKAARAEVTKFYEDAIKGEMEYQALLRSRELDTVARGKTTYNSIIAQLELLKKQSPQIQAAYDKIYSSLQGQEYVDGQGFKHGTWLRKAKTWDIMASLNGAEYSKLEELYLQGKLKDTALADFEALKKLKEELVDAGISIEDLQAQLNELLSGTSVEGLSNALSDLFENGKLSAQDFGDSFESILKKAIVNGFKYKYIEKEAESLFAQLSAASEDGSITKQEADDFRKASLEAGERLTERWKLITEGLGVDFANSNNSSALTGGIAAALTESTGSELAGLWRGQYDITKKQYAVTVQMNTSLYELTQNSVKGLNQLISINNNTANTVTEVKNLGVKLDRLVAASGGRTDRDPS